MATRSKMAVTRRRDRFSSLPDSLIHHIFSFLKVEDLSRLMLVSKKFRHLCFLTPFLTLDDASCRFDDAKRARMMNYIDRILFFRREVHTHRLYIRWYLQKGLLDDEYRVITWLKNAAINNVKQIVLDIILEIGSDFTLSLILLRSPSLETLTVCLHDATLKVPSSISYFSGVIYIECFSLQSARIDNSFGTLISTCCKFLKKLRLRDTRGATSIFITSSSLAFLAISTPYDLLHLLVCAEKLQTVVLEWRFNSPETRLLHLSTPKLETFLWKGHASKFSYAENFNHLVKAGIFLTPYPASIVATPSMTNVFGSVGGVKYLALLDENIKDCQQIQFTSLQNLHVEVTASKYSVNLVRNMATLFKGTPNLRRLSIKRQDVLSLVENNASGGEEAETAGICGRQDGGVPMPYLSHVTMDLITQGKQELELIKYLLKHTNGLQMMTLFFAPSLEPEFYGEVAGFEKASLDAQVQFIRL